MYTRDTSVAIRFVTSQTRGRCILPKGTKKPGETDVETCHREGFEEAGAKGVVLDDFPITVLVTKQTATGKRVVPVPYYPFLVTEQFDEWPEKDRRQRHWALIEDAPPVASPEDLVPLIQPFRAFGPWHHRM